MKKIILLTLALTSFNTLAELTHSYYKAMELSPAIKTKIEKQIERFVGKRSSDYAGPSAAYEFTYSCNEADYGKIYCSISYDNEGGMLGQVFLSYEYENDKAEFLKIIE